MRDILKIILPVFFQSVNIMKGKEKQNHSRLKAIKETWQLNTKCDLARILNQKNDITGTIGEFWNVYKLDDSIAPMLISLFL